MFFIWIYRKKVVSLQSEYDKTMKKLFLLHCLMLCLLMPLWGIERVTIDDLQDGGWQRLQGKTIQITSPLYLCGIYYDSLILAPERMYVPEERAVGLADGDSTMFFQLQRDNRAQRIRLSAKFNGYELRTGAVIRNLRAQVVGQNSLLTGQTPHFRLCKPSPRVPDIGNTDLRICSANIQNFFYDLGGYAGKNVTRGQFALQRLKVATALLRMDADIYALCELEKGDSAPRALVESMNALARRDRYAYVRLGATDGDTISVGFVYRKDRVEPYGEPRFAYEDKSNIYAYRFVLQGWQTCADNQRFIISLNHLRSKRGEPADSHRKRMANIDSILVAINRLQADELYADEDILVVGDFNSYTQETPIQAMVRAGYADQVMRFDSLGYSYVYNAEMGYLDRCFASPAMAEQITSVRSVHWNADTHYTYGYKSKYNYKNRVIPKDAPDNIRSVLSRQGRDNILYRYADHDPLLIGIRFRRSGVGIR